MSVHRAKLARSSGSSSDEAFVAARHSMMAQGKDRQRSGACVHCKSLKVRCEFSRGNSRCQRCVSARVECVPRQRKKRKPAATHEDLLDKARQQDAEIERILEQLENRTTEEKLRGMLEHKESEIAQCAGQTYPGISLWSPETTAEEAVSATYSSVRPSAQHRVPDIVKFCGIYPEDIKALFNIYFEKINPFFSVLDVRYHTPEALIWTSPFLFTVVCAAAAKYYRSKPLSNVALSFAQHLAGNAVLDTSALDVSSVQAFMIMAVYASPKKKFEEDRASLLIGVAMRMAIRLELNAAPPVDCSEQEAVNRTRTWLTCFCMDGAYALRLGKTPFLAYDDPMTARSHEWYHSSPNNTLFDVHLCAYVQMMLTMARFHARIEDGERRQPHFDLITEASRTAANLSNELSFWATRFDEEYALHGYSICNYRGISTQMIGSYLRLIALATGFQKGVKSGHHAHELTSIAMESVDAACAVIRITIDQLAPSEHFIDAIDSNFLYVSFSSAYLLNLLRPRFSGYLDLGTKEVILQNVSRVIEILNDHGGSVAQSYAKFLKRLVDKMASQIPSPSPEDALSQLPNMDTDSATFHTWLQDPMNFQPVYYPGPPQEMDFSLNMNTFVQRVAEEPGRPAAGTVLSATSTTSSPGWSDSYGWDSSTADLRTTWSASSASLHSWKC